MNQEILKRIAGETGISNLSDILSGLSGADLHSLLLTLIKNRLLSVDPASLNYDGPVTKACNLDGRLLNSVESLAYSVVPDFSVVELSPLMPLGSVGALTGLDQGNVLSTIRAYECSSDPTVALALECAQRRKKSSDRMDIHKLCSGHRVVRFPQPKNPAFTSHFKLFSMVSAGRDTGSFTFELAALREHVGAYLSLLSRVDFKVQDIVVQISDTDAVGHLCAAHDLSREEIRRSVRASDHESADRLLSRFDRDSWPADSVGHPAFSPTTATRMQLVQAQVMQPLKEAFPAVGLEFNLRRLTGLGYYSGPCFHIKATNAHGQSFMLADGGFVDWTKLLLNDKKERLMTSAIGTELLCRTFAET